MTTRIYNKLKSNTGASLVLVMVLFLLCVMVSSVIVSAASAGAARNANRTNQQQGYLAMSSAVDLIMAELSDVSDDADKYYQVVKVTKEYDCCNSLTKYIDGQDRTLTLVGSPCPDELTPTLTVTSTVTGNLKELIKTACDTIYSGATSYTKEFTIKLTDATETRIPDVRCKFMMNNSYGITLELEIADEDRYPVDGATITLAGIKSEPAEENPRTETSTDPHSMTYQKRRGRGTQTVTVGVSFTCTKKTYTTTITWENLTYSKGVADDD